MQAAFASLIADLAPRADLSPGTTRLLTKDEELFAEGEEADCFFKVASGVVRTCRLLSDGRRQVDAFHVEGDFLGLEAGGRYRSTAEAVGPVRVIAFRCRHLPAVAEAALASVLADLRRAQDHVLLLGRKTAPEKMATFLLAMAERLADGDSQLDLPMPRADIADHLGLTIETVSRTFRQFVRQGLIGLQAGGRSVVLHDRSALRLLDA